MRQIVRCVNVLRSTVPTISIEQLTSAQSTIACRVITDPKKHSKSSDTGRRAVVAVLLPREHLPFIRDWCLHHIEQGREVVLYDNTGSVGSTRKTSAFSLNRWHDLPVTIIDWQPRDADGRIVHGQVEAYVDYVPR